MRPGSPPFISEPVSGNNDTCELMKIMALEVPDTRAVNFVEAESLLHGKVPLKQRWVVLNSPTDRMGLGALGPSPTLLGMSTLKARVPKVAHGITCLPLGAHSFLFPDHLLLVVKEETQASVEHSIWI